MHRPSPDTVVTALRASLVRVPLTLGNDAPSGLLMAVWNDVVCYRDGARLQSARSTVEPSRDPRPAALLAHRRGRDPTDARNPNRCAPIKGTIAL